MIFAMSILCLGLVWSIPAASEPLTLKLLAQGIPYYDASIVPDNKDEFEPTFESFYERHRTSWWHRWAVRLGLRELTNRYLHELLKPLLLEEITRRELLGYSADHVVLLDIKPQDKIILWGDLRGGCVSLIRCLLELERQGIIDNRLHIKEPNYYLLFNGNVVGRSPYSLDTLALVLALMHANPGKVFYIRGQYEAENSLFRYALGEQLALLGEHDTNNRNSLRSLVSRFVMTLPSAVYIDQKKKGSELLRISSYGRDRLEINEQLMGSFFDSTPKSGFGAEPVTIHYLSNREPVAQKTNHVRVLIRGLSDETSEFVENAGFILVDPQGSSTTWMAFSAPTRFSQLINNFHHDAFVVLEFGSTIEDVVAHLWHRDTRTTEPFVLGGSYDIRAGETTDPVISLDVKKAVNIGSTLDLSKQVASMGRAVRTGIRLCLKSHNKARLRGGRYVQVIIFDDGYNPERARENIDYLMKQEKVDVALLPVGTPTLEASLDLLEQGLLLVLFPITGAAQFRTATMANVIHWRPPYATEVDALITYLIKKHFAKTFVFFYQNDSYGLDPLVAARGILKRAGIEQWVEIPYSRDATDFKEVVEKIRKSQPDALGLFATSSAAQEMLRQLGGEPLVGVQVFGTSFLVDSAFQQFTRELGFKYVFPRAVPNPDTSQLPVVKEYRAAFDAAGAPYSPYSLEAYIGTSLLLDAIAKVPGTPTRAKIKQHFEAMQAYDYKGLILSFNKEHRSLTRYLWLDCGTDDWLEIPLSAQGELQWN